MRLRLNPLLVAVLMVTASCSTNVAATTTSEAAPLVSLALNNDGLGDVLLGFPPDVVAADISALFGEPDLDTGWIPADANLFGSCPGESMRAVGWGSLVTIFINEGTDPLGERFYTYTYGYDYAENEGGVDPRGLDLSTENGIGIGATVMDLESVYGSDLRISGDVALDIWSFDVADSPLRGLVTGPDAIDTVTLLELAPGCD